MRTKRFGELSSTGKAMAIAAGAASLAVIAFAERDLQGRPDEQIRGPKLVWRLVSLNALGALSYLRWGRR